MEVGEKGDYYTCRYTVTTRMTPALKMGSDESHFNVSLVNNDVHLSCSHQCPERSHDTY